MTMVEMVRKISENTTLPNKDIEKILDEFVRITKDTLKMGEKVSLTGLGSFTPKERKGRIGRNPKTGEAVKISTRKVVKFKPGKELVEMLEIAQ